MYRSIVEVRRATASEGVAEEVGGEGRGRGAGRGCRDRDTRLQDGEHIGTARTSIGIRPCNNADPKAKTLHLPATVDVEARSSMASDVDGDGGGDVRCAWEWELRQSTHVPCPSTWPAKVLHQGSHPTP